MHIGFFEFIVIGVGILATTPFWLPKTVKTLKGAKHELKEDQKDNENKAEE